MMSVYRAAVVRIGILSSPAPMPMDAAVAAKHSLPSRGPARAVHLRWMTKAPTRQPEMLGRWTGSG